MENAQSGELIPVARRVISTVDDGGMHNVDEEEQSDLEHGGQKNDGLNNETDFDTSPLLHPTRLVADNGTGAQSFDTQEDMVKTISQYNNLAMLQRGIFLAFQGLLAGFSFTTLYIRQTTVSTS